MAKRSYRNWVLTLKAEGLSQQDVEEALKPYNYVAQLEAGEETGYQHYQIYIHNKTCIKFQTLVNKLPGVHAEPRKGTAKQAYDYCTKEETRVGEPFGPLHENLPEPEQGRRKDLDTYYELIQQDWSLFEIVRAYPSAALYRNQLELLINAWKDEKARSAGFMRPVEVFYIYGKTRVGKTYKAGSTFDEFGIDTYTVSNYGNGAFDGYAGEDVLILDEFSGQLPISEVLRYCDGYRTTLRARYSDKQALYTKVIFLSNLEPTELYKEIPKPQRDAFLARFNTGGVFEQLSREEFIDEKGNLTNVAPYAPNENLIGHTKEVGNTPEKKIQGTEKIDTLDSTFITEYSVS